MKRLGPSDRIVLWHYVRYEVGALGEKSKLYLDQSNPYYPSSHLILESVDDLYSPRSSTSIKDPTGYVQRGSPIRLERRLLEYPRGRGDTFHYRVNPGGRGRCWGTVT